MSTFIQAVKSIIRSEISKLWTAIPCEVIRVNTQGSTISVDVKPLIEAIYESNYTESLPIILNVPVMMPSSDTAVINIPIKKGSKVLCVFSKFDLDNFVLSDGDVVTPASNRSMDYNDAIAIPGLYPFKDHPNKGRTLPFSDSDLSITANIGSASECSVVLADDGSVTVTSPLTVNLNAPSVLVNGTDLETHTHNVGSAPGVTGPMN